ncbi:cytochrome b-c1 complex subunit 7 [Plakobranchus ocellatus]|uniref:Cytochrome b-c1 complex subunit 7 n=1 Tax=Plakobranchus ocellatus TaxID=259542 RepID=A0AAV4AXY3_9GAST|nr:cytochrome b-c1 complex subunit 7 [Plakobranchus ocellatus]
MAAPARQAAKQALDKNSMLYKFKKWCYNKSYFRELGLRRDDIIIEGVHAPVVKEALRRIPKHELDARHFRIMRAQQLSMMKTVLPKEEWTQYEDDVSYLQPYIDEVIREVEERKQWDSA